jgi:hypothetical protein
MALFFLSLFFGGTGVLSSGSCTCSPSALPLEPYFQPFCTLVIFQIGSHVFLLASDHDPATSALQVAGITDVTYHTKLFLLLLRWGFAYFYFLGWP